MFLEKILRYKKESLERSKLSKPLEELLPGIDKKRQGPSLREAISKKKGMAIIGEIKKASPSKGRIVEKFNPSQIGNIYEKNQIEAISVLTEEQYFEGKLEYLREVRAVTKKPILRKDFIIDPYQVYEARLHGADAILLIASILSRNQLIALQSLSKNLGMETLVEIHTKEDLEKALDCDYDLIGINNRDLTTFQTDLKVTEELLPLIPSQSTIISESGIHSPRDMAYLEGLGVQGVLIGESLMRASSIPAKIKELRGLL